MAPRKKTQRKTDPPTQPRNVQNDVIYIVLVPILFITVILCSAFFYVTLKSGQMPSADALTTIFKHVIDLLTGLLGKPPAS